MLLLAVFHMTEHYTLHVFGHTQKNGNGRVAVQESALHLL